MARAVGDVFSSGPAGPPDRRCPSCGAEAATFRPECPACGKRYDRRAAWLSDRARWLLGGLALLATAAAAALVLPGVFDAKRDREAATAAAQAERVAAERVRLAREQRPRRGGLPAGAAPPGRALAARRALVGTVEAAILADARARIATGELDGPARRVACGPLVRTPDARGDEEDPARPRGRYDCVAVQREVLQEGRVVGLLGHPYVATIDFARGRWVFCKDNKAPGEAGVPLAKVPLERACLGAEGSARVGDGYAAPEE